MIKQKRFLFDAHDINNIIRKWLENHGEISANDSMVHSDAVSRVGDSLFEVTFGEPLNKKDKK